MDKIMPLDVLSSISGAKSSEAVDKLFRVIKGANSSESNYGVNNFNAVQVSDLRDDVIIESSEDTKRIIKENFPVEKNGYLVVSKVIED